MEKFPPPHILLFSFFQVEPPLLYLCDLFRMEEQDDDKTFSRIRSERQVEFAREWTLLCEDPFVSCAWHVSPFDLRCAYHALPFVDIVDGVLEEIILTKVESEMNLIGTSNHLMDAFWSSFEISNGFLPVHCAIRSGRLSITRLYLDIMHELSDTVEIDEIIRLPVRSPHLEESVISESPNFDGASLLHIAAVFRQTEILQHLLRETTDTMLLDNVGKTPLHYAVQVRIHN